MYSPKRLTFGLFALSALLVTSSQLAAQAVPEVPQQAQQCELKFEKAEIAAGSASQELTFTLALPAGAQIDPAQIRSVNSDDESGLQIGLVDGKTLVFTVDATGAKAGSWEIRAFDRPEAKGDAQAPLCVGKLMVQ